MSKKILITGGSGLVGAALTTLLLSKGYTVVHLSRTEDLKGEVKAYAWDYLSGKIDARALEEAWGVIHLAGAGIADKRWTDARKQLIIDSRVKTAKLLFQGFNQLGHYPEVLITASGINYYGSITSEKVLTETDLPHASFIGQCCVHWEDAANEFSKYSRVVMLRTGVVLSALGGALPKIAAPVRLGFGAPLGSGEQWMPYIHMDDLCQMYLFALENEKVKGAYNAVNGDHLTNKMLTQALAKVLHKALWLPAVPAFALKLALGEMAEILLEGSQASNERIKNFGFNFKYPEIQGALKEIYTKM
jgi:hypothetical protein